MTDAVIIALSVIVGRTVAFSLAALIRFGIGLAAFSAGAALPIGMMLAIRAGWF